MGYCIKCNKLTTHHHSYCDDCYPQKSATILFLKQELRNKDKEIFRLNNTIKQIKSNNKKMKYIKSLKNQIANLNKVIVNIKKGSG